MQKNYNKTLDFLSEILQFSKMNYSLLITGFKTKAQVKAFYDWYEGQGEQNAPYWFECRKQEGEIDVETMYVDLSKPQKWNGDTLEMKIKPKQLKTLDFSPTFGYTL